ncbi:hypothetical protein ID866_9996 [Astraeus odoratus]|nr:hypothetical protein ID866_9996 [Astraeus odoratus]
MPVPVPSLHGPLYPTQKHSNPGDSLKTHHSHYHGRTLSLSSVGLPPALDSRDQWFHSLPSKRFKRGGDSRPATAIEGREWGFRHGLAGVVDAPAIKGAHAEACIPPMYTLVHNSATEVGSDKGRPWTAHDAVVQEAALEPSLDSSDDHRVTALRGWSSTPNLSLEDGTGTFAPVLEDDSSDLVNGDSGSSPMEPLTPFAEYVDRAVATSEAAVVYDPLAQGRSQELHIAHPGPCGSGCSHLHAYPGLFVKEEPRPTECQPPPTATLTYKQLAEPMAEWIVTFVWKVCTNAISLPQSIGRYTPANAAQVRLTAPLHLTSAVHSLLMSTLLQPSAILLALWYIARLPVYFGAPGLGPEHVKERRFRVELLGDSRNSGDGRSAEGTATFRLIVLGFMLANKWLDDHTFSNKTWHNISNVPVQSLNRLEYFALDILLHDLSISPSAWADWLKHLLSYHHSLSVSLYPQPISRPSMSPHSIIRKTIQEIMEAPLGHPSAEPVFLGVEQRLREKFGFTTSCGDTDSLDIDLDEDGPLREEYLPRRRASDGTSSRRTGFGSCPSQQSRHPPSNQLAACPLPPARWSPIGNERSQYSADRIGAIYIPAHPSLPPRYGAPAPVMYQAWPTGPATYFPLKPHGDSDYMGNYMLTSRNPCWCPAPHIRAPQQAQSCCCTDFYRSSTNSGGYSHGSLDRCCDETQTGIHTPGYPSYTTSWVLPDHYNYAPSRQPLGPHAPVNYQSNWLRA